MSHEEIFKKVIDKAIKCGWNEPKLVWEIERLKGYRAFTQKREYYSIIFNHDFARAFWGTIGIGVFQQCLCGKCEPKEEIQEWMIHLQTMALKEEPLEYLEKFL